MSEIKNINLIKYLAIFLLFSIFLQIIIGAWVRLTGSGMSCPDWPLCYGFIFPTPSKIEYIENIQYTYFQIFLEWIHRANAAFVIGPISIFLALIIFIKKNIATILKKYAGLLLVFLAIQGGLGGLTVFKSNIPWSVAIHLMFAFLLYLTVLLIIMKTLNISNYSLVGTNLLKYNTILVAMFTLIAACLGAFTSKYGASLSCNNWPGCTNNFFPDLNDSFQLIHFSHRVIAFSLILLLVMLLVNLVSYLNIMTKQTKLTVLCILIVSISQIIFGALLILLKIPIWLGILHQAFGLLLFTLVIILNLQIIIKKNI